MPDMPSLMPTPHPRSLPLEPQDWFWATWRDLTPLTLAEARPFEPEKRLASLKQQPKVVSPHYWLDLKIPRSLTLAEAQFWFLAMTCPRSLSSWSLSSQNLIAHVQKGVDAGACDQPAPSETEALAALGQAHWTASADLILPLLHFFSPEQILPWILDPTQIPIDGLPHAYLNLATQIEFAQHTIATALVLGWQRFVTPYLTAAERERCRQQVGNRLEQTVWTLAFFNQAPPVYYLAANLGGFGDPLQRLVSAWPDQVYQNIYRGIWLRREDCLSQRQTRPQEILFGLADPERVAWEMERLDLPLNASHYLTGWLAHREYQGFGPIPKTLLALSRKEDGVAMMRQLVTIVAPELAPTMLSLTQHPPTAELASRWLSEHSSVAMAGILGSLPGQSKLPKEVHKYLQRQVGRGEGEWMQAWLREHLSQEQWTAGVQAELASLWAQKTVPPFEPDTLPPALHTAFEAAQFGKSKLPKWLDPGDFPPLRGQTLQGEERSLARSQMEKVLQACRQSSLNHPHTLVICLKEHLSSSILADFAWQLLERWLTVGAPPKDQWALHTLGLLGNDTTVLHLTPLIRAWPGEGNHKRASAALDCLKAIGTEAALMQIHAIAQRIPVKSLKTKATECMTSLAQERGLTEEQLADRIVPNCGLDAQGSKVYDYGSRQFRVALSADLKPLIRDSQNKLKVNLPRPTQQDDRSLAEAALADWKTLKKTLGQVVSLQSKRLERAMIDQRRWSRSEFETYLLGHPILRNLGQRLVWGAYPVSGAESTRSITNKPITTFRVTEDGTYADGTDADIQIPSDLAIGIVHPAELETAPLQGWGQLLSDYEIVPPFSQLSRTVFGLLPEEENQTLIRRFAGAEPPALIAAAIFKNTGWHASTAGYYKPFPQAALTAIVSIQGWGEVMPLEDLYFVAGLDPLGGHRGALPLAAISPVVLSEVLRNVGAIASKTESSP